MLLFFNPEIGIAKDYGNFKIWNDPFDEMDKKAENDRYRATTNPILISTTWQRNLNHSARQLNQMFKSHQICSSSASSWSAALPQPSWNPISSWVFLSSAVQCKAFAV